MSLDLDVVRTFVAAADRGTFRAAAGQVCRTQAAVSQQMQRLESSLGEPLFARDGRLMRLSPAGERFLGYAKRLIALSDEAALAVRSGITRSVVRLGVTDDLAAHALMPALVEIRRSHPQWMFEIQTGPTRDLLHLLGSRLDLVAGLSLPDAPAGRILARQPLQWVGHWDGAGAVPLALYPEGCLMRGQALAALDRAGIAWEITAVMASVSAVEAAARAGMAVGVLARGLRSPDVPLARGLPKLAGMQIRLHAADRDSPVAPVLARELSRQLSPRSGRAARPRARRGKGQ